MALYYISISLRLVSSKRTSFYLPLSLDFPAARWYKNDFFFYVVAQQARNMDHFSNTHDFDHRRHDIASSLF